MGELVDPDQPCATCGRDNRNGTHSALERTGHLSHLWTPPVIEFYGPSEWSRLPATELLANVVALCRQQQALTTELIGPGEIVLIEVSRVLNTAGEKVVPDAEPTVEPAGELDIGAWVKLIADDFDSYREHELPLWDEDDIPREAVAWTLRCLVNARIDVAGEVLQALVERRAHNAAELAGGDS